MAYFTYTQDCQHYPNEWEDLLNYIKTEWPQAQSARLRDLAHHIEAKALYVFTTARRLIRAANWLKMRANGWKPVFLEATVLLFPMIELIGYSRVDDGEVRNVFGDASSVSAVNLWAGLHWLRDPTWLPAVQDRSQRADSTLLSKWQIGHLVSLRHYLLHGSRQATYKGKPIPIDDIINYELPEYIVTRAQKVLSVYWQQLRQDDGSRGWVKRLAQADIRPLSIQGSSLFDKGLVDPDIVDCLEGNASFL